MQTVLPIPWMRRLSCQVSLDAITARRPLERDATESPPEGIFADDTRRHQQ
jgi:hypothetical protein